LFAENLAADKTTGAQRELRYKKTPNFGQFLAPNFQEVGLGEI